jgi:hypothetical protein
MVARAARFEHAEACQSDGLRLCDAIGLLTWLTHWIPDWADAGRALFPHILMTL